MKVLVIKEVKSHHLNKSVTNTWTKKTAKSKARERHRCSFSKENDGNKKYQKVKNIIN